MSIFTYGERATNCCLFTVSHMKHPAECLINILPLHLLGCHTIPMLLMRKQPLRILITYLRFSSVQFSSVAQLCPILCDPMNLCCPLLLLPSKPASGSFQMSQLFASGGQSIGISASTSVLPMNTQD